MSTQYSYLKKYVGHNDLKGTYFSPVSNKEIHTAEKRIHRKFPDDLIKFYQEIGSGILSCGEKYPEMLDEYVNNEILSPRIAADYMLGILEHPEEDDYYMAKSAYEDLEPGDLPFFEIGDGSSFMIMKLNSSNSNAVWFMGQEKIEDSLEKFIWNLYYDHPSYYTRRW